MPPLVRPSLAALAALFLGACAGLSPSTRVEPRPPVQWQAPLPHQGSLTDLKQWWAAHGDPLLVELIDTAQTLSPNLAAALARIESARAQQAAAQALLLPALNAQTSLARGVILPSVTTSTRELINLQASWELDYTGANRAAREAAQARVEGSQAQWHEVRVLVAAEVAQNYQSLHACQRQLEVAQRDAQSADDSARITGLSERAGMAPADSAALARAGAADSRRRAIQQQAQCDLYVKALVALVGQDETELRRRLQPGWRGEAPSAPLAIAALPIQVISQRPDVFAAERDIVIASAQVGSARAAQYPRLSLDGSIGAIRISSEGVSQRLTTWSFGPLAVSLPLFDGGQRAAAVGSAQAAYDQAIVAYQGKVRQAVREVEEALVTLRSAEDRLVQAHEAWGAQARALEAVQARHDRGLANRLELEAARRGALAAESAHHTLLLERQLAWIALYRAAGGGFEPLNPSGSSRS